MLYSIVLLIISSLIILAVLNRFTEEKRYRQCRELQAKYGPIADKMIWCSVNGWINDPSKLP